MIAITSLDERKYTMSHVPHFLSSADFIQIPPPQPQLLSATHLGFPASKSSQTTPLPTPLLSSSIQSFSSHTAANWCQSPSLSPLDPLISSNCSLLANAIFTPLLSLGAAACDKPLGFDSISHTLQEFNSEQAVAHQNPQLLPSNSVPAITMASAISNDFAYFDKHQEFLATDQAWFDHQLDLFSVNLPDFQSNIFSTSELQMPFPPLFPLPSVGHASSSCPVPSIILESPPPEVSTDFPVPTFPTSSSSQPPVLRPSPGNSMPVKRVRGETCSESPEPSGHSYKNNKRFRIPKDQMTWLKQLFDENPLPSSAEAERIAAEIGVDVMKIKIFFQNRRAAEKRRNQGKSYGLK